MHLLRRDYGDPAALGTIDRYVYGITVFCTAPTTAVLTWSIEALLWHMPWLVSEFTLLPQDTTHPKA